uniref:Putative secreted protein n=1 Tax=Ixodes ricinus TaxID=34613 RepID=A0A6B0TV99_IXORI
MLLNVTLMLVLITLLYSYVLNVVKTFCTQQYRCMFNLNVTLTLRTYLKRCVFYLNVAVTFTPNTKRYLNLHNKKLMLL